MKFREHRGGLVESMLTVVEVDGMEGLVDHLSKQAEAWPSMPPINATTLHVEPYGHDSRINWDTHIVTLDDYGVLGFTDGPAQRRGGAP